MTARFKRMLLACVSGVAAAIALSAGCALQERLEERGGPVFRKESPDDDRRANNLKREMEGPSGFDYGDDDRRD